MADMVRLERVPWEIGSRGFTMWTELRSRAEDAVCWSENLLTRVSRRLEASETAAVEGMMDTRMALAIEEVHTATVMVHTSDSATSCCCYVLYRDCFCRHDRDCCSHDLVGADSSSTAAPMTYKGCWEPRSCCCCLVVACSVSQGDPLP